VLLEMLTDHHRWFLDVPLDIAKRRVIERHIFAGIEKTREAAAARVQENNIENGSLIRKNMLESDIVIVN
jgi:pantothenate kinase